MVCYSLRCSNSQRFQKALNSYNNDATIYNVLGNAHFNERNFDEAIDAYQRGLEIELQNLGSTHPNVIVTLSNLSETYKERGDYELALKSYYELLRLQNLNFGTMCHPDIAATMQSIAWVYDVTGQLSAALYCIKYSLALQQQFNETSKYNHIDFRKLSMTLSHAGCLLFRVNRVSTAMKYFDEALLIQRRNNYIGEGSFTIYNIALCHQSNGYYDKAIKCYTEALRLEEISNGKNHKDSSATLYKLGQVYFAVGDLDKALFHFHGALEVERENFSYANDLNNVARILIEIGYVHYFQGCHGLFHDVLREICELEEIAGGFIPGIRTMYQSLQCLGDSCQTAAAAA